MKNIIILTLLLIGFSASAQVPANETIVSSLVSDLRHYNRTNATPTADVNQNMKKPAWTTKGFNSFGPDYLEYRSREVLEIFYRQKQFFTLINVMKADIMTAGALITGKESILTGKEKERYNKIVAATNTVGDNFSGCAWLVTFQIHADQQMLDTWGSIEGYSAVFSRYFTGDQAITDKGDYTLGSYRIAGAIDAQLQAPPNFITVVVYDDVRGLKNPNALNYAPICWGGSYTDMRFVHVQELRPIERVFRPVRFSPCDKLPGFTIVDDQPELTSNSAVFTSDADTLFVSMFDDGAIDGDVISITVDGTTILPQYTLQRLEKGIFVSTKNSKESTIEMRALSEGTVSPCTLTFFVEEMTEEGKRWGPYSLMGFINPKEGESDRLTITIKKKSSQ